MASGITPVFSQPSFVSEFTGYHPIPFHQTAASFQELSSIDARIQEIILHLEIPTQEQKALSCIDRFLQTTTLKSELQSLHTHLLSYEGERSNSDITMLSQPLHPIRGEHTYQAFRLRKFIDHTKHLSPPANILSLEEVITRTQASYVLFHMFLTKLNSPSTQSLQEDQQSVENISTSSLIEDIRINLEMFDHEITEINRGNFLSSSPHRMMNDYYYQVAEQAAKAGIKVLMTVNQMFHDHIKEHPTRQSTIQFMKYKIQQTKFLAGNISIKLGLPQSLAHAANLPAAAAVPTASEQNGVASKKSYTTAEGMTASSDTQQTPPVKRKKTKEPLASELHPPTNSPGACASSHPSPYTHSITPPDHNQSSSDILDHSQSLEQEFDPFVFLELLQRSKPS